MKAIISTLSLAFALTAATPAFAQAAPTAAPTAADADAFIAAAEKDLFDYTVEASQVNWVNSTYLTEDTDAMASRINAV
ncbi:MAG: peptidase M2 family protein, partial [Sphingopyxis sp.]|nr:peptidase M2 family protein [Sphingopyxis sp.]